MARTGIQIGKTDPTMYGVFVCLYTDPYCGAQERLLNILKPEEPG